MNTKALWVLVTVIVTTLYFFAVIPTPAFLGALFFLIGFMIYMSIHSPKEGVAKAAALWGTKLIFPIKNSKKFELQGWNLSQVEKGKMAKETWYQKVNIYILPWPLVDVYRYPLTYNRRLPKNTQRLTDKVIYTVGEEVIVERTSISDHIRITESYPIVTRNVRTKDGGVFNVLTTHVIRAESVYLPFAETSNWLEFVQEKVDAMVLAICASLSTMELIALESSDGNQVTSVFTDKMQYVNLGDEKDSQDGILEIVGMYIANSTLGGIEAADEPTRLLLVSLTAEQTAKNVGAATVATAKAEGNAAKEKASGQAEAIRITQQAEIDMARERLVQLGLLKVTGKGKKATYEQVAEINAVIWAKAFENTKLQYLGLDGNGFQGIMAAILSAKGGTDGR